MMAAIERYKSYAPALVRIAVSLVFLWFGVNQLVNPESFLGYVPNWLYPHAAEMQHAHPLQLLHNVSGLAHWLIMGNGFFEMTFGLLLLLGFFTRLSALLLSIHLVAIAAGLGYNDMAVRDLGLAAAAFSVFLNGPDRLCIGKRLKKAS